MTHILKRLGCAGATVLAFAFFSTSIAHAEVAKVTASAYPATLTSTQLALHTYKIGPREIVCEEASATATLAAESSTLTTIPTYGKCITKLGSIPATVTTNGCTYTLSVTSTRPVGPTTSISTTIDCPVGKQIEVHFYENAAKHAAGTSLCTYDINAQGPVPGTIEAHTRNVGTATEDIELTVALKEISEVSTLGPAILCGAAAGGHLFLSFTGTTTLTGSQGGEHVKVMIG